jgi:hypothetical protein
MFKQNAPKKGTTIHTPAGDGRVVDLLAPNDSVTVDLGEGRTMTFKLAELDSVGKAEVDSVGKDETDG